MQLNFGMRVNFKTSPPLSLWPDTKSILITILNKHDASLPCPDIVSFLATSVCPMKPYIILDLKKPPHSLFSGQDNIVSAVVDGTASHRLKSSDSDYSILASHSLASIHSSRLFESTVDLIPPQICYFYHETRWQSKQLNTLSTLYGLDIALENF